MATPVQEKGKEKEVENRVTAVITLKDLTQKPLSEGFNLSDVEEFKGSSTTYSEKEFAVNIVHKSVKIPPFIVKQVNSALVNYILAQSAQENNIFLLKKALSQSIESGTIKNIIISVIDGKIDIYDAINYGPGTISSSEYFCIEASKLISFKRDLNLLNISNGTIDQKYPHLGLGEAKPTGSAVATLVAPVSGETKKHLIRLEFDTCIIFISSVKELLIDTSIENQNRGKQRMQIGCNHDPLEGKGRILYQSKDGKNTIYENPKKRDRPELELLGKWVTVSKQITDVLKNCS